MNIELSPEELALLVEALDSHEYWQLTDESDRNDGYSQVEEGASEEIDLCRKLYLRLETLLRPVPE